MFYEDGARAGLVFILFDPNSINLKMTEEMFHIEIVVTELGRDEFDYEEVRVSRSDQVSVVIKQLEEKYPGYHISMINQLTQLQDDDIMEDIFEEGDVLTAIKTKEGMDRADILNASGDVVVLESKNRQPIFLEPQCDQTWSRRVFDFSPAMTVFRRQYMEEEGERIEVKVDGENVYEGCKYKIPKDKDTYQIKIREDSVQRLTVTGDVEDIPPVKDTVRKVLGGFLSKPVGKALQIEFENSGGDAYIITGGKMCFDPILVLGGTSQVIKIKPRLREKYQVGVAPAPAEPVGQREFTAEMFQVNAMGRIRLERTEKEMTATLIRLDTLQEERLKKLGSKVFKDAENFSRKDILKYTLIGGALVARVVVGLVTGGASELAVAAGGLSQTLGEMVNTEVADTMPQPLPEGNECSIDVYC